MARGLLSLDLGSVTGFAVGDVTDAVPYCDSWELPLSDPMDLLGARVAALENTLGPFLVEWAPAVVVMALAFTGRNAADQDAMGAYYGMVRSECWRHDVRVLVQPEITVRTEVHGRGKHRTSAEWKQLAMIWCKRNAIIVPDHNAADAAVLWCWTRDEILRGKRAA
jgi:Holliday junction resolvasome RuvABC endonuclease subunit